MQWMKWAIAAAIGCAPALVRAEDPAPKKEISTKYELRLEVQTNDGKPKVFVLGDGDSKESKDAANQARKLADLIAKKQANGTFVIEGKFVDEKGAQKALAELKPGQLPQIQEWQLFTARPDQHGPMFRAQVRQAEKGTFLGITTDEPPAVLQKQLGLAKGMGLVIDDVIPGSPAAKAGLQQFDVIQKLDDQIIVNQPQLSVLVRAHKAGDEVKLTVIREAKPTVLTAKLIEHEIPGLGGGERQMIEGQLRQMLGAVRERREEKHPPQKNANPNPQAPSKKTPDKGSDAK